VFESWPDSGHWCHSAGESLPWLGFCPPLVAVLIDAVQVGNTASDNLLPILLEVSGNFQYAQSQLEKKAGKPANVSLFFSAVFSASIFFSSWLCAY
jgi:hypothetical protein